MTKKPFGGLADRLSSLGDTLPTQQVGKPPQLAVVSASTPAKPAPTAAARTKAPAQAEERIQQAFALRPSLRKELHQLAAAADVSVQTFILKALRAKGLSVTDADLIDRRKVRG